MDCSWTPSAWCGTNSFTSGYSTDEKYFGAKSLIINVASYEGDSRGRVYQDFSSTEVKPGGIYTLSGYVKTVGVANSSNLNSGAFICAESVNSDGTTTTSKLNLQNIMRFTEKTVWSIISYCNGKNDWQTHELSDFKIMIIA